ncbi:molybdopterin-dependent oxidoreductase [Telluria mixta]|uniref:Molybdopterin-dependent oxidoreductase n=1 Tax=Telluria mixta TaxID=34071 RepID=A0ABT2BTC9_9BURK|nr:molybdopterin-dependent oxidoreductase [Telluria mixta]MCS0627931.1 molybdopterin-dependent oxidoreductase [Telluria mixta]WEM93950.1 molybdopterin-dependent oxidoreductase [Telluria mixta]
MTTHQTACILCSRNCGLLVDVENEQLKKIRGDESAPTSKGYICQKAARLVHYQSNEDRLQYPLKRQPDGSFVRVTWDEALSDIASRLLRIKKQHGGKAFAFYGGGGQGNHLGGAYSRQLLKVMKSFYLYTALGQEKTGDFWVNGRMFGRQDCHTTEDVENADFVLFIGTNPYQAHGIPNARDTLKHIKNDPVRTMVVVDPRRTETAKMANTHLQLRPGTDAFLMAAMLSIIVRENLHDKEFLAKHCNDFDAVEKVLLNVPVDEFVRRADVPLDDVYVVARGFATARRACVRIDLGIQQTLNSTLNSYLEKLLYLVTGNFGIEGGNNLHSVFLPVIGHTDERNEKLVHTVHNKMFPISGIFPPNILPSEIDNSSEDRVRALFVDSGNPALTTADTPAVEKALSKLELLVVVDVAMTETARYAHYVLPASSQYEKFEATGFNLEFPTNYFHLRHPVVRPIGESLSEAEIYTQLLEKMGVIPKRFPILERIAKWEPKGTCHVGYIAALAATITTMRPNLAPYAASVVYRTLGKSLGPAASASTLLPICMAYAKKHGPAVMRAGVKGNKLTLGTKLFRRILGSPQGAIISTHEMQDVWSLIAHSDRRVHLLVPEMLDQLRILKDTKIPAETEQYPLILMAGERRNYNANQIYRDPKWRKQDHDGCLKVHPNDAEAYGLGHGEKAICRTESGAISVVVEVDDATRPGFITLPHGYGMKYENGKANGPQLNRLTSSKHCDPFTHTPYHKFVPAAITPLRTLPVFSDAAG